MDAKYLHFWFMASLTVFMKLGQGTTVPGIKLEDLWNSLFPLPPLAEQRRIVAQIEKLFNMCNSM